MADAAIQATKFSEYTFAFGDMQIPTTDSAPRSRKQEQMGQLMIDTDAKIGKRNRQDASSADDILS